MPAIGEMFSRKLYDEDIGHKLYELASTLYPICRSITGNGVRETLKHVKKVVDIDINEVPSGTNAFDWKVPREWNIRDAYIKDPTGRKIVDFKVHNLHVLNYSIPVNKKLPLSELKKHIYTMRDQPDLIPYRTSYYNDNWGFCMAHNELEKLQDGIYEVFIDSDHNENGSLTYGEYFHQGETDDEFLFSSHCCHPSLANDNCSGISVNAFLASALSKVRTRHSYRFIFAPGTIGSITWLSRNQDKVQRIKHGLIVSCVGDPGGPTYKRSQRRDGLDRPRCRACVYVFGTQAEYHRLLALRLRRAPILLAGIQSLGGADTQKQIRGIPRVPHVERTILISSRPEYLARSFKALLGIIDIVENRLQDREPGASLRAQSRQAGPLWRDRRGQDRLRCEPAGFLGAESIGWDTLAAGYRGKGEPAVRKNSCRGQDA